MRLAVGDPDAWQQQILTSPAPRMLLNCSRQSGKSSTVACLALHRALTMPGSLTLLVSPSLRQSMELFRKIVQAYTALGHLMPLEGETKLAYEFANTSRLIALHGTEHTIRGYSGVDLLIIDEAALVSDDLYYACKPFMAVSNGTILALSTPHGTQGWWHAEWTQGQDWQRIQVRADQCSRISAAFLAQERLSLPRAVFEAEYMCTFHDAAGRVFASADINACLVAPGSITPWGQRNG
jgi:hypothetical protein